MNQRQKKKYGLQKINTENLWNLDSTFTKYIYPRLKAFKKMDRNGYPSSLSAPEEWEGLLDEMILSFELLNEDKIFYDKGIQEIINKGLEIFAKYYQSLWD